MAGKYFQSVTDKYCYVHVKQIFPSAWRASKEYASVQQAFLKIRLIASHLRDALISVFSKHTVIYTLVYKSYLFSENLWSAHLWTIFLFLAYIYWVHVISTFRFFFRYYFVLKYLSTVHWIIWVRWPCSACYPRQDILSVLIDPAWTNRVFTLVMKWQVNTSINNKYN